jgi:signal transduction histidine kinase/DNA-binding response OmpR family regulator
MIKFLTGKASKILYRQILFTVLAFFAMTLLSYVFLSSVVRGNLIRNTNATLDFTENHILKDLADSRVMLNNFSENVKRKVLSGASAAELKAYIEEVTNNTQEIVAETIDVRGFYAYFESLPGGPILIQSDSWYVPNNRVVESDWYQAALAAQGGIIETVPYIHDTRGPIMTFARAIYDETGRRLGIVCIDVSTYVIGENVVHTALGQGGYGMLAAQNYLVLSHPNIPFVGLHLYSSIVPMSHSIAGQLQNGDEVFEEKVTSFKGEESVVFFRTLPNGWYLGLVTPTDQYYRGIHLMLTVLVSLGSVLAIVLIAILISIDDAREKSDEESRQKSMFLANMSHEIRTPINAIVGMTAIGKVAGVMERKDYCFSKIEDASRHLLGVINDILDISKIEANKIELSPTDFNFEKLLQQVVNVINFRVEEKHQKLSVHIDKNIPKILYADDQRLAQVITNLLGNAVKFTPTEGNISIDTHLVSEEDGEVIVKIAVTDDGIGITPQQQANLFQSFQQAESSTTRKYGGTGLGLAISKSIVEMMGGTIWVESELHEGATFAFTVKIKRGDETNYTLGYNGINWHNIRILVIDDDNDILVYFREIITSLGARCDTASNAEEAFRLIEVYPNYNVIFVDLKMPDIDGITMTKEIRDREETRGNSVVVMISSADLSSVEIEAKKAGVNRFLLKPLFPSSIADVINECIGNFSTSSQANNYVSINNIFAGYNLLFVEDIEINREIVIALLEPTQVNIDCAENGVQAVKMFCKNPEKYDLIFMDVQMPEMDGYEATRQIRSLNLPQGKTIPIVAMTANVFKEDIQRCLDAGMNGHLGKPLNMEEVIASMRNYLWNK